MSRRLTVTPAAQQRNELILGYVAYGLVGLLIVGFVVGVVLAAAGRVAGFLF